MLLLPPLSKAVSLSMWPDGFLCHTPMGDERVLGERRDDLGKRRAIPSLGCLKQRCARSWTSLGSWFAEGQGPCKLATHLCRASWVILGTARWVICSHVNVRLPPFLHCSHCSLYRVPPCPSSSIIPGLPKQLPVFFCGVKRLSGHRESDILWMFDLSHR